MSETSNRPKVIIRYIHRASKNPFVAKGGFDAEFEIGWKHTDGHERFRTELCALLDGLHETHAKWNGGTDEPA